MKDYSICDDTLLDRINTELAHIGCFLPISVIEETAIRAYDLTSQAHCTLIGGAHANIVLDKKSKDDTYYRLLTDLVCVELIANARLAKARNKYEVNSILTLLQSYLDDISDLCRCPEHIAAEVFSDMLNNLDYEATIYKMPNGNAVGIAKRNNSPVEAEPSRRVAEILKDLKPLGKGKVTKVTSPICNNQIVDGPFKPCDCQYCDTCNCGECDEAVVLTLAYSGLCFGVKVDPVILGLNQPLSERDIEDKAKVLKNFIGKASNEFKKKAMIIYSMLWKHFQD